MLVIDELAELTAAGAASRQQRDEIVGLLRSLLALGRAVGVAVVAATQRPAVDTVPAPVRDLFAYRLALRCSTRDQSDTILGAGWVSPGFTAAEIRDDHPGEGWLLAEDGAPERVRARYLPDAVIPAMVGVAAELRRPLAAVVDLPAAVGPACEETTA